MADIAHGRDDGSSGLRKVEGQKCLSDSWRYKSVLLVALCSERIYLPRLAPVIKTEVDMVVNKSCSTMVT